MDSSSSHKRGNSHHHQQLPSRPTTPLRPSSRTSLRSSTAYDVHGGAGGYSSLHSSSLGPNPLAGLEPAFAELADGMADLEANFMHLQLLHESLSRFNENFAAFLYGMNMNAFCVDFPEAPVADSFRRAKLLDDEIGGGGASSSNNNATTGGSGKGGDDMDPDMTIVSTATSFVDHPTSAGGAKNRFTTPTARTRTSTRGQGRGAASGTSRGSSISRAGAAAGRGAGRTRASGIARGTARGRAGVR